MAKKTARKTPAAVTYDWIVPGLAPLAVEVDELTLDPANARKHGEADVAAIAASLQRYKQRTPIVVNKSNGQIEKGNGTLLAARSLGWSHIAVVFVEDDDSTQRGYAIADNRTAELSDWDLDRLADQLDELSTSDADLYDALMLDQLRLTEDEPAEAQDVPERFEVVVECSDEVDQKKMFDQLKKRGYTCRLLTL